MIQCGFRDVAPLFGGLISRVREREIREGEREKEREREQERESCHAKVNVAMVIHARRSRLRWSTPAFTDQLTNVWTLNR